MDHLDDLIELSSEVVRAARDANRPEIETVVETYRKVLDTFAKQFGGQYREVMSGPDAWAWIDDSQKGGGERWISIGRSAMKGTEGYPLLTIRMSVAPNLDSFLTLSQLVVGRSETEIEYNLAMAISNHIGAFEGLRAAIAGLVKSFSEGSLVEDIIKSSKEIN